MKILITTHHLKNRAGSELFTFDLVMEFKKRGHDVFVFSNILGKVSEEIERSGGIPVTNNLSDFVNENIDIIHAQHNTTAMMARSVFPNTPMVFMSHGILPDLEQPPTENLNILNIFKYLVVSNEAKDHLTKKYGISKDQIKIVRSFIDTNKFFPKKEVNLFPKKLLVVSNHYRKNTKEIIESACKELGIEVTHVGLPNNSVENVEDFINDSDIVVSLGRGAIEAMACGRNVIIYDIHGGDGLINEDNFFEIRKNNFSGRRFRINYNVNKFKEEILKYNPRIGEKLRKLVLRENSKNAILKKIEDIYRDALYYDIEKAVEIKNVCNYEKKLKELLEISKQKDQKISELYQIIRQKVQEIASSNQVIQKKDRDIKVMKSSKFWKLREKYLKLKKILLFADNTRQMVTKPASNYLTSVIITAHNYGKFLKDCIDSVLEQTVKPKEIIVVNDASNDNTDEIVKIYENKVQYFKVDFKDAQKARNFGFSKAIGEYVVFLDSDDYFYEDAIEKMQSEMESNPELNLVYSDRTNFGDETILKNINQASKWSSEKFNYGNLKTHNYIPLPSLIRRKKFKGFDERIKRFQDWDAWLTLLKNGKAKRITEPLYFARFHGKNKTFTVNKYIEKLKILHKHNIIKMARVKDKREKLILERTVNLSKSRIIFLISIQIDISSIKKFLYSVDKYHQNKNFLFYLIKNNQEESNILEITHVLERTGIEYRIVRKYNIDQVVKFVKENSIIPLYDADYLVMFRRSNNPDLANFIPGKEIHALYDCEKDILSVNSLDEINALVLNKRGIGTLIGL